MPESEDQILVTLGETSEVTLANASRSYLSRTEIEAWAGYCQTSFKIGNDETTISDWVELLESLALGVSAWIDRYCRRTSFYPTQIREYRQGRGRTGELGSYREQDRVFLLREQPVIGIISVREDLGSESGVISWADRTPRTTSAPGDYQVLRTGDITEIRFIRNIPRAGYDNLEITYMAGYNEAHPIHQEIKNITREIVTRYLEKKKKSQEADVARWQSTDQAADLLRELGGDVLTEDLKARLAPYQRRATMGRPWR
jgi:hypothetical protein